MDQSVKRRATSKPIRNLQWLVALPLMAVLFIHAGPVSARSAPDSFCFQWQSVPATERTFEKTPACADGLLMFISC